AGEGVDERGVLDLPVHGIELGAAGFELCLQPAPLQLERREAPAHPREDGETGHYGGSYGDPEQCGPDYTRYAIFPAWRAIGSGKLAGGRTSPRRSSPSVSPPLNPRLLGGKRETSLRASTLSRRSPRPAASHCASSPHAAAAARPSARPDLPTAFHRS